MHCASCFSLFACLGSWALSLSSYLRCPLRTCVGALLCVCVSAWTHGTICQSFSYLISYRPAFLSQSSQVKAVNWFSSVGILLNVINCIKVHLLYWTHLWSLLPSPNIKRPLSAQASICVCYTFHPLSSLLFLNFSFLSLPLTYCWHSVTSCYLHSSTLCAASSSVCL